MVAYMLVDTKIHDLEAYEEYKTKARPIAEKFGGIYRARGGEMDLQQTDLWQPTRLVLVEFPDMASAQAFLASEEYAPVKKIRLANATCTTVLFEGV